MVKGRKYWKKSGVNVYPFRSAGTKRQKATLDIHNNMKLNTHNKLWRGIVPALLMGWSLQGCDLIPEIPTDSELTADAGADQTVFVGTQVTLDGSASSDSEGNPFDYEWMILSAPSGSAASITGATTAAPTFTPDVAGQYFITLTISNENDDSTTDDVIITAQEDPNNPTTPVELSSIVSDTELKKIAETGPDYRVNGTLSVSAALTIAPGVIIEFAEDAGLMVGSTGSIEAIGKADSVITFTGIQKVDGFWRGMEVSSNNTSNELTYVVVEYAGSSGFDGADLRAGVMLEGSGRLKMNNDSLRNITGYGLYLRTDDVKLDAFNNNVLTANNAPVMTSFLHFHRLNATNTFTGNEEDYIDTYETGTISSDATWPALGVPYHMPDGVEIIDADITVEPGAHFVFQADGGLHVDANGSLNAEATASNIIIFEGEVDERGYWRGLSFGSNNTSNNLTYVIVRHGGSAGFDGADLRSNVIVEDAGRLTLVHVTLSKSAGAGLYTRNVEVQLPGFSNNLITDNVVPVVTLFDHYHYFDSGSDFTGNDDDYLETNRSGTITADVTWQALNVPYRLSDGVDHIGAALTIMPGAEFIGIPGSGLEVTLDGSLTAEGTSNNHIVFRGEQDVTGYWRGLQFNSNNPNNSFDYVDISNGGSEGFDGANRKANLEVENTAIFTITNSTISKSGGYGIRVLNGGGFTESGNTYTGNVSAGNASGGGVENDN